MIKYDIISIGSATVDVFVDVDLPVNHEQFCYPSGEKILINNLNITTGGGGTNSAVCFLKLGLKTGFVGCLGKDKNSDVIIDELKKENVNFLGKRIEVSSGYSIIFGGKNKNRTLFTWRGSNDLLKINNFKELDTKWFYFSSMLKNSFETQKKIAEYATKNNINLSLNISTYQAKRGLNELKPLLKNCKIFILNKEESEFLFKNENVFKECKNLGVEIVVITNGEKEVVCSDGNFIYRVTPIKTKVIDNTGAGDCFASTFTSYYIKTQNIENSLKCALLNASSVIQIPGAKNGLLSDKDIKSKLNKARIIIKREVIK
jgi:ribokinase